MTQAMYFDENRILGLFSYLGNKTLDGECQSLESVRGVARQWHLGINSSST